MFHWKLFEPSEKKELLDFLLPREYSCVFLSSTIRDQYDNGAGKNGQLFIGTVNNTIQGTIHFSSGGLVLPAFNTGMTAPGTLDGLKEKLRFPLRKVHTCIGRTGDVGHLESILPSPVAKVDYFLMVQENQLAEPVQLKPELKIRSAGMGDARKLFTLHTGYEKEEVLLDPSRFNKRLSFQHLEHQLGRNIIYYALLGHHAVSKAGTNAIGYNWCQLGGVYTLPEYRSLGYGKQVVSRVCSEVLRSGKKTALFVKKNNGPALSLYRALGFSITGEYRISYFI